MAVQVGEQLLPLALHAEVCSTDPISRSQSEATNSRTLNFMIIITACVFTGSFRFCMSTADAHHCSCPAFQQVHCMSLRF